MGGKITLIGTIISLTGLVLLGVSLADENWVTPIWGTRYNFLFASVMIVGLIIEIYGNHVRQSERRILDPKEIEKF